MVSEIQSVAFQGIKAVPVSVQVHMGSGLPAFTIVGLPDKAVAESKERIRSALHSIGLALPPRRITVNLAPASIQKEGSHFDLPIAIATLMAMDILPNELSVDTLALGELALDGAITAVNGVLPAAHFAASQNRKIICPAMNGPEAVWGGNVDIIAANSLTQLINHFQGKCIISLPEGKVSESTNFSKDFSHVKGQPIAKRALEIAAAGGHNVLMSGPPGSGKSMLAECFPSILPDLTPKEALEVSMIHSISGHLEEGKLLKTRPFRAPHHSASLPSLVGGGHKATPGEISLAHSGVLFLDELPEFARSTLESLRQPLETGHVSIARANAHITYPANFQLIAAQNPCKCGYATELEMACSKVPQCMEDYQSKISGPLLDRIDLFVEVRPVSVMDLQLQSEGEKSEQIRNRVLAAREIQKNRFKSEIFTKNSDIDTKNVEDYCLIDTEGKNILETAAGKMKLSTRAYYRIIKVARTIADLEGNELINKTHLSEALLYRQIK